MSRPEPRLTHQTLKVLRVFLEQPNKALAGSDIWKETGIFSGTLYPILARLEKAGWLTSSWEAAEPSEVGRPRKRLYRLTGVGQKRALGAFEDLLPAEGRLGWSY